MANQDIQEIGRTQRYEHAATWSRHIYLTPSSPVTPQAPISPSGDGWRHTGAIFDSAKYQVIWYWEREVRGECQLPKLEALEKELRAQVVALEAERDASHANAVRAREEMEHWRDQIRAPLTPAQVEAGVRAWLDWEPPQGSETLVGAIVAAVRGCKS